MYVMIGTPALQNQILSMFCEKITALFFPLLALSKPINKLYNPNLPFMHYKTWFPKLHFLQAQHLVKPTNVSPLLQEELYLQRVGELDKITDLRDQQRKYFEELRKQRLDEFMAGFSVITNKLKEMYQMITLGGDAELELVDSLDPFSEGIVFR